jgi:hypothetical protein
MELEFLTTTEGFTGLLRFLESDKNKFHPEVDNYTFNLGSASAALRKREGEERLTFVYEVCITHKPGLTKKEKEILASLPIEYGLKD